MRIGDIGGERAILMRADRHALALRHVDDVARTATYPDMTGRPSTATFAPTISPMKASPRFELALSISSHRFCHRSVGDFLCHL
jgi:hypothetical protein